MFGCGKSRLSYIYGCLFLAGGIYLFGQQKANDFTKRVGVFDGKMSNLSGRASKFNRLSPSSARRISVEEWPAHFSPFGGKRFPVGGVKILGKERISSSRIEIKTPLNDRVAKENFQRATNENLSRRDPAAHAVEFRDAYYARLNDRVEEWMNKVNNMSLQDINRYQFRRDRPKEPGFPVQRAGAEGMMGARSESKIRGIGLPANQQKSLPRGNQHYWMGPKKITTVGSKNSTETNVQTKVNPSPLQSKKNYKASPKPILGPKTIRVEVGGTD